MRKIIFFFSIVVLASCTFSKRNITSQNYRVEFYKADFEYSQQLTGTATVVRILGIDWKRLFNKSEGGVDNTVITQNATVNGGLLGNSSDVISPYYSVNYALSSIPIIGSATSNNDESYAVHDLLMNNQGYDVLIFPLYESKKVGIPIIYTKNQVKVTARLARIKN